MTDVIITIAWFSVGFFCGVLFRAFIEDCKHEPLGNRK